MHGYYDSTVIYLDSVNGSDDYNGLSPVPNGQGDGPLAGIETALEMIGGLRLSGDRRPMTVAFCSDYTLEKPISLWHDNGFLTAKTDARLDAVTFTSYGRRRRLSGAAQLTDWKPAVFNGVACLACSAPRIRGEAVVFTDLYVNGRRAGLPCFPADGSVLRAKETEQDGGDGWAITETSRWFIAKREDLEGIDGIENAIVSFYHYWVDEHSPVESYDRQTGRLTLAYRTRFKITTMYEPKEHSSALRYFLENIPQSFGKPGEWYYDRAAGIVYYTPLEGESADTLEAFAPLTDRLLDVRGREGAPMADIHFENLEFAYTQCDYASGMTGAAMPENEHDTDLRAADSQSVSGGFGAIGFTHCVRCSVERCHIHHVGIYGVSIGVGCRAVRVENNEISDLAAGGVRIFGGTAEEPEFCRTSAVTVRGNHIFACGQRYHAGCGVLLCHAAECVIEENEIDHTDYSGISVGWRWGYAPSSSFGNLIRRNDLHHIGMGKLSDMAAIYTLGQQPGTVIEENRIHDVLSAHYGGYGIYLDEGSSMITVRRNVVFRTKNQAFYQHYGIQNVVRNNIFAMTGGSVTLARDRFHNMAIFENNIFCTEGEPLIADKPDSRVFSRIPMRKNLFFCTCGEATVATPEAIPLRAYAEERGLLGDNAVEDPRFRDAENGDFTLLPDSPAIAMGFSPISGFPATDRK